jgi:outer membrane protein assembly factor BamB/predicted Ser/Thr protein kinase
MIGGPTPGAQIGRYVIEREVGRGGMGIVYRALDPALNRPVALKLLGPAFGNEAQARQRFHREAAAIAKLKHPHIALVYEFGETDGQPFIALEWIEGSSLRELLTRDGPWPPARALSVLEQLAAALDYAHARNIVHRDLKPANVMVGPNGQVTLVDFGLARLANEPAITVSDSLFGTPRYVAPEQIRGEALDGRADQYSLAVMAYEMLTGQLPFDGNTTPALLHHHLYTPPIPVTERDPSLPPHVELALQRALAKERTERFASAGDFVAALRGETVASASESKRGNRRVVDTARRWAAPLGITVAVLAVMGLLAAFALNNFNSFNAIAQATLNARLAETQSAEQTRAAALTLLPTATAPPTEEPTLEPTPEATPLPTPIPTPVNNPPADDGWWPMVSGDSLYSGRVWAGFPALNTEVVWSRPPIGELGGRTAMVAGGGFVFFATNGGFVRALNWTTGLPQPGWRTQLDAEVTGEPVLYGDESHFRLLVALESGGLAGLEASGGELVWQRSAEELNGSVNALTLADGRAYAATGNGWLNVVNPVDGETFGFDLSATDGFYGAPAISEGIAYLTGYRQAVYAVSVETGQVLWAGEVRGNPSTPPSVSPGSGRLFVGTDEGFVHALWLASGNPAWPPTRASSRIAGLAYDEARVYAVAEEGQVYAWWIETGELAWAVNLGAPLYAAPLTDGGLLAVVTPYVDGKSNGDVRFLRVSDGGEETSLRLTTYDGGYHPPAFAGGWLFVPGWAMYAFGPP